MGQALIDSAYTRLEEIVKNLDTATGEEGDSIGRTEYKSWNLNPAVSPPDRLVGTATADIETL